MDLDFKKVRKEAEEEVLKEKAEIAKEKIKAKLKAIDLAEKVVKNLKCELEDLEDELQQSK